MGSVSTSKEHIRLCLRFSSLFSVGKYALDQIYIHVLNVLFVSTQTLDVTSLVYKPSILRLNHQDDTVKDMSPYSVHRFPVKLQSLSICCLQEAMMETLQTAAIFITASVQL